MISHPPQLNGIELRHSVAMRFTTSASISTTITFQNLLDLWLFAASATAVYDIFQSVKIRRVRVWAVPVLGNAATVLVEFGGLVAGITGDQVVHTDTSMGVQPAHVDCRPNVRSLASNYQIGTANEAFALICPSGSVIDVELSYRGAFATAQVAQNVAVGATTGAIYIRGLDGLAVATSKFVAADVQSQI
jgi:hypothetical protein